MPRLLAAAGRVLVLGFLSPFRPSLPGLFTGCANFLRCLFSAAFDVLGGAISFPAHLAGSRVVPAGGVATAGDQGCSSRQCERDIRLAHTTVVASSFPSGDKRNITLCDARVDLTNRGHGVGAIGGRVLGTHHDAGESAENVDRPETPHPPVADRLASRRV